MDQRHIGGKETRENRFTTHPKDSTRWPVHTVVTPCCPQCIGVVVGGLGGWLLTAGLTPG